jgi:hypothetical protein
MRAGSFRSDIVEERLRRSLEVFRLPAAEFVAAMLPSMFSKAIVYVETITPSQPTANAVRAIARRERY